MGLRAAPAHRVVRRRGRPSEALKAVLHAVVASKLGQVEPADHPALHTASVTDPVGVTTASATGPRGTAIAPASRHVGVTLVPAGREDASSAFALRRVDLPLLCSVQPLKPWRACPRRLPVAHTPFGDVRPTTQVSSRLAVPSGPSSAKPSDVPRPRKPDLGPAPLCATAVPAATAVAPPVAEQETTAR